jgi:uncharacterized protein YhjY with autotransporter beta-barrel domain
MRLAPIACRAAVAGILLAAVEARSANPDFQAFFFQVCGTPSGALASRCAETPGGLGNLSGDSESSLNPSQNLSQTATAATLAQARSKQARERGERLRDGAAQEEEAVQVAAGPVSLLVNVHATWFERDVARTATTSRGFDGDSSALEIGADYRLSQRSVIGALVGIERTQYEFDPENTGVNFVPARVAGSVDSDATYLTLFGSRGLGASGFVEASGGYERHDGTYRRNSVFQESTRTRPQVDVRVAGDAVRTVWWASINGGFDFSRDAFSFGPYAGLTATHSEIEAYTERDLSGSGLNMRFGDSERDSLLGHAGVRASRAFSGAAGVFVPQARIEYQHEFDDDAPTVASRFVLDTSGTEYGQVGGGQDEDFVVAGLSLSAILPNGWICFADYSVLLEHEEFERERATLGVRVEF